MNDNEVVYRTPYTVDLMPLQGEELGTYMAQVSTLPQLLIRLISDQSTARYLNENIAVKFGLSQPQAQELTRVVRDVLLSAIYIVDLAQNIQTRLGIQEGVSRDIANTLATELFGPVMNDIKALQMAHFGDRIAGQAQAPQRPQPLQPPARPPLPTPPPPPTRDDNVLNLRH